MGLTPRLAQDTPSLAEAQTGSVYRMCQLGSPPPPTTSPGVGGGGEAGRILRELRHASSCRHVPGGPPPRRPRSPNLPPVRPPSGSRGCPSRGLCRGLTPQEPVAGCVWGGRAGGQAFLEGLQTAAREASASFPATPAHGPRGLFPEVLEGIGEHSRRPGRTRQWRREEIRPTARPARGDSALRAPSSGPGRGLRRPASGSGKTRPPPPASQRRPDFPRASPPAANSDGGG